MKPSKLFLAITLGSLGMAAQADTFKIDPVESSVVFSVMTLGLSNFHGRFNDISGTVVLDKADPSKSSFDITIPVESVDTKNEKRDQHLKSPDFFNAKQFPVMTFKSKKVEGSGNSFTVTGDFSLHGVTQASDSGDQERLARPRGWRARSAAAAKPALPSSGATTA